ncbi:MAG: hypothetical protein ACO1O1_07795 [Adhaeribacter sp.]
MKKVLLSFVAMITCLPLWAQRDVDKEILIYFQKGVSWETQLVNGLPTHVVQVTKESLKQALKELDILESDLIVALPDFNRADTIRVLPDGKVIPSLDMSKIYIYTVKAHQNRKELVLKLRNLPEVLIASENGTTVPDSEQSHPTQSPFSAPITSTGLFSSQTLSFLNNPITIRKLEDHRKMPPKGQVEIPSPVQGNSPFLSKVSTAKAERRVSVYPNPAREKLRLEMLRHEKEGPGFSRVDLYDALSGKMVRSVAVQVALDRQGLPETVTMEMDVWGLPRGLYHLQLVPASGMGKQGESFRIILE